MSTQTPVHAALPPLPLAEWEPTKDALHLWAQIVGKVRMASAPPRNHWWHATLSVAVRGLTTGPVPAAARWVDQRTGSLAVLPYDAVRASADPKETLLAFLESTYQAGAGALGWDAADLRSSWCPDPPTTRGT